MTLNKGATRLAMAVFLMCGLLSTALQAEGQSWTVPSRYDGKTYTFRVGTEDQHYVNAIEDGTVIIYFRNDGSDRPLCSNPIGITVSGGSLDGQVHMNLAPGRSWRIPVGVHKGGEIYVTIHNGYVDQGDNWTATIYEMCVGFSWN